MMLWYSKIHLMNVYDDPLAIKLTIITNLETFDTLNLA